MGHGGPSKRACVALTLCWAVFLITGSIIIGLAQATGGWYFGNDYGDDQAIIAGAVLVVISGIFFVAAIVCWIIFTTK